MNEGWVKIHRKVLDNPIVCKDYETFAVWMYLLLNATHTEYDVLFKGKRISLKEGQLLTGRKSIAEKLKMNESKVQRILKMFEIEQQIEQQMSSRNRLVTILNWDKYQKIEQQIEQQVNNKRTTSEQQVNTNKNVKNIKNINNNNIYGQSTRSKPGQSTDWENKFNEFYSLYPKKVKKQQVKKWFEKVKPSNELFSSIMDSLEQFRASTDWQKDGGQFIPHPSTWLNQSRWEDEVKAEEKSAIDSWYERMSKLEGADNDT